MANNVRQSLIQLEDPVSPNYKSTNIITQKTYPVSSIINASKQIEGNLEFQYTVPAGYRQDVSRSYIVFDTLIAIGAGTVIVTTAPAFNICASFFNTGRLELNDYLASQSNNIAQDDTVFKRLTNSYTKYTSIDSAGLMYGSDTERFNSVQTVLTHQLAWKPECLMSPDMVIPENVKCHMILSVNPNINVAANSPAFVSKTDAAGDGLVKFNTIYMVNTFIKVETPLSKQIFIPAYSVRSSYQMVGNGGNNLQFTIPKDTYKIVVALQSSASTIRTGAVSTKFSSGTGVAGITQSDYSQLLTSLQLSYAGQNYPATQYTIEETATASKSMDCYLDYLGATDGAFDPSGSESYTQWKDPKILGDVSYGRLFAFNIVKPSTDEATNAELMLTFSAVPGPAASSTRCWLFAVQKCVVGIAYGENRQIAEVKSVPFN